MLASHTSFVHGCLLINIRPTSFLNNYSLKGTNAIVRNPEMSGKFFKHFSKRRKLSKESETIEETFLSDVKPILWGQFGYEPVKIIGYGSYAKVILANSSRHNTKVAIKIVSKIESKSDYVDKFLPREIDIVKKVRHPHLITFLQTIETNARVYLVMELANKGCMLDIIRKAKRLSEPASGVWFKQICDAAEYLHSIGIVHRDLKCENLLLDIKNNIKIIDFGFARSNMLPINGAYKLSETFCGSYAYACPEILTGTPYVGQMADIWSIGIILYVFVIGELPFNTDDKKALVRATQAGPEFEPNACSNSCKRLIEGILLDEDRRMWFPDIRSSRWYTEYCLTPDDNHISKYTLDSEK